MVTPEGLTSLRLLTSAEVCDILGISKAHLSEMRRAPDQAGLPVIYVGSERTPRYSLADVQSFIQRGGTEITRKRF